MRIGQVFTYRGPFPWQCCLCPVLVRAGDQAVHYWHGTKLMIAHDPATCLDNQVQMNTLLGSDEWDRTTGLRIMSPPLSPTELHRRGQRRT